MSRPLYKQPRITKAVKIAEQLFTRHIHASAANDENPNQIVYKEADVIQILQTNRLPLPDFEGYAKLTKIQHSSQRMDLLSVADAIKKGMEEKEYTKKKLADKMGVKPSVITRALSGANLTLTTLFEFEHILDIKLVYRPYITHDK